MFFNVSIILVRRCVPVVNFHPQTKFGARYYFHRCLSTGEGGLGLCLGGLSCGGVGGGVSVLWGGGLSPKGGSVSGRLLSRGSLCPGGILCPGGVSVQGESLSRGLSPKGGSVSGRLLSRGSLCPGGDSLSGGSLCPGGCICPGGVCPGGCLCPGWSLAGVSVLEVSVQRGFCVRGPHGGSLSGGTPLDRVPLGQ